MNTDFTQLNLSHRLLRFDLFKFVFIRVHSWFNYPVNPVILSKRRGFTLVELMVAVGLMGLMIAFTSIIFRFGIDAHRFSSANAEIMQKARAITEQLNSDFRGLRQDAPLLIWFQQDNSAKEPNRYDQIMFFADGDFSSWQLYRNGEPVRLNINMNASDKVVRGNVARIQYALASSYVSAANHNRVQPFSVRDKTDRNLARRCHILTADDSLDQWPDGNNVGTSIDDPWPVTGELKNEVYEHDSVPISRWKALDNTDFGALGGMIIHTCFDYPPLFDSRDPNTFGKLLCERVSSFSIQWAYWDRRLLSRPFELRWFPGDDPDGDKLTDDSHFTLMQTEYPTYITQRKFGAVFNIRGNQRMNMWMPPGMLYYDQANAGDDGLFPDHFFPTALKFTFTVYDSKGIIKDGRTFTHIVYLNE